MQIHALLQAPYRHNDHINYTDVVVVYYRMRETAETTTAQTTEKRVAHIFACSCSKTFSLDMGLGPGPGTAVPPLDCSHKQALQRLLSVHNVADCQDSCPASTLIYDGSPGPGGDAHDMLPEKPEVFKNVAIFDQQWGPPNQRGVRFSLVWLKTETTPVIVTLAGQVSEQHFIGT